MTQDELRGNIYNTLDSILNKGLDLESAENDLVRLCNQHVKQVVGEDIVPGKYKMYPEDDEWSWDAINQEKAEQRKRAGL